jgi:hypothetical protein
LAIAGWIGRRHGGSVVFPDFEEFVRLLNAHEARYLIIGGYAVGFHARPRATKDIDILVEPTRGNATRVIQSIQDFFGVLPTNLSIEDFMARKNVVQLGRSPVRIDIVSGVSGVRFAAAWPRRVEGKLGSVPANYVSLGDLIKMKKAAGRAQDRADVAVLERAKRAGRRER